MLRAVVVIGWIAVFAPGLALARDYVSSFGIGISVPETYLALTRRTLQENAAYFVQGDATGRSDGIPGPERRALYERVRNGELEIFYRTEGADSAFVDNVNITEKPADLPSEISELQQVCALVPLEFSRLFGRPMGLDDCEMRAVGVFPAIYLAFEGALQGTRTMQYHIQTAPGRTLIVTGTALDANVTRMLGEFEKMVASIRMR
jgi:hypothetical protein